MNYWVSVNAERTNGKDTGTMGFTIEADKEETAIAEAIKMVEENGMWKAVCANAFPTP
jgi:tRNA splicing ligase